MYNYTEEVASQLNGLLEKNYDAEKGYRTASENAKSSVLTSFFERKANQRKDFGKALKTEIRTIGEIPKKGGSVTGKAHRVWMNTKAFLSPENDESMLEEALRGEKASIEEYNKVINSKEHLPKEVSMILEYQRDEILADAVAIKKMEDLQ